MANQTIKQGNKESILLYGYNGKTKKKVRRSDGSLKTCREGAILFKQ